MTQEPTADGTPWRGPMPLVGGALLLLSVGLVVGLVVAVGAAHRAPRGVSNALLYVDVPGRIAVDGALQVEGPAPIPVSAGTHRLTFLDTGPADGGPAVVSARADAFHYVSPDVAPGRETVFPSRRERGLIRVSVFPPDSLIEIPDCTPKDAPRPTRCRAQHTLAAEVSPGTYVVRYTHPDYPTREESVTASAGEILAADHSFLSTVAEWDAWRRKYPNVLRPRGGRSYWRRGNDLFEVPFEAVGDVVNDLFGFRGY